MKTTRRSFLKSSALAASALALPASSWAAVRGANEDIRVAVIGFNGRGKDHIEGFRKVPGVRLVALCDADRKVLEAQAQKLKDADNPVKTYVDVRELLASDDIDAVSVATPNHWHALMAIWACQHGKDVYLEKPVSHNVWEGRQIVRAARKYGRIVQTGTQSRSNPGLQEAVAWIHGGGLGEIRLVRGLCYKPRQSIGLVDGPQPIPDSVEYDLWCGPSPLKELHRKHLHYDWHWDFDTGCGDIGNQGIHQMDIARWVLRQNQLSPRILSVGGRLGYIDDGNTPNTQFILHSYPEAPLIFEVRGLPRAKEFQKDDLWSRNMPEYRNTRIGVTVDCADGTLVIPSYDSAIAYDDKGNEMRRFHGSGDHFANFIAAVRSRRAGDLNADIAQGHLSSALCHTGNISHRLGRKMSPEAIRDHLAFSGPARETFERMKTHLIANGVDLERRPLTLGETLEMDPAHERFINNEAANRLLTREYRYPFIVPEAV
ncbi:MAG TPA: Gfo/Idh/MocA family oxidoreductase [Candidatus Limnocylindria bacterium]|jgi:predicted dehydrogenase|nr:Gfo/Idh/MocA family oxidoreductase [Candidatus Limnocylindria bacterium]